LRAENDEIEMKIEKLRSEIVFLKDIFESRVKTEEEIPTGEIKIETIETDDVNEEKMEDKKDLLLNLLGEIQVLNNSV